MKLIYPHEFKMNHKTLYADVGYEFGTGTGSMYLIGSKKNISYAYEINPKHDSDGSLHKIVNGRYTL